MTSFPMHCVTVLFILDQLLFQLRKPVSTLSIPGAMKSIDRNREDEGALVGVHAENPKFGELEKRNKAPSIGMFRVY